MMTKLEVHTAARNLELVGLPDRLVVSMMAWVEKDPLTGSPLSEGFRLSSDHMLQGGTGVVAVCLSLCAAYIPAVEQNAILVSLLTSLDFTT